MKVIFEGFETMEQARAFAEWYSGQGEQDSADWLQEHSDIKYANEESRYEDTENKQIVVQLKLYK